MPSPSSSGLGSIAESELIPKQSAHVKLSTEASRPPAVANAVQEVEPSHAPMRLRCIYLRNAA